jgi:hypothetical protein
MTTVAWSANLVVQSAWVATGAAPILGSDAVIRFRPYLGSAFLTK